MALVIQKNKGREGIINAQGGVFNAPRVAGQIGGANIQQQISITGGTYEANPAAWADEGTPVAQLTAFRPAGRLRRRRGGYRQAAAGVSEGDEIDVLSGDVALTNLPTAVMVTNSGGGTVSANGEDVAAGDSYTVETPLAIRITAQPRDAIVTEARRRRHHRRRGRHAVLSVAQVDRRRQDVRLHRGGDGASYTTSATTVENDGYRYDCLVIEEADKDSLADLGSLAEGRDYVRSSAATLTVKAARRSRRRAARTMCRRRARGRCSTWRSAWRRCACSGSLCPRCAAATGGNPPCGHAPHRTKRRKKRRPCPPAGHGGAESKRP